MVPGFRPSFRPITLTRPTLPTLPASLALLGALSSAGPALAQATAEAPPGPGAAMAQMLFGLGAVLALLFAGAWLLRRLGGGARFGQRGPLKLVGGLMLGNRERVVVVEVGDSWLVIGIVPGQIRTLHCLPKGPSPQPREDDPSFRQWLKQISERKNESP